MSRIVVIAAFALACAATARVEPPKASDGDDTRLREWRAARERDIASWPADWPTAVGDGTEYGFIGNRTVLKSKPCAKSGAAAPIELRLHLRRGHKKAFVLRLTAKNCLDRKVAFFHSGKTSPSEIVLDTPKRAWVPRYVCDMGADRTIRANAFLRFQPDEEKVLTQDGTSVGEFVPKIYLEWEDQKHELPPGTWRAYATFKSIHDRGSSNDAIVKIPNVWLGTLKSNTVELEIR